MNRMYILFGFLFFSTLSCIAQIDTTLVLNEILISDTSVRSSSLNSQPIKLNDLSNNGSIAQLIEQNSNTYIKNYGPGSLSTFSMRGGSAGQSLILWNGLPLQSPMLGLMDLSLIPNNITDKITLTKGGNSSMWGSGAMSGLLSLNSTKNRKHTIINSTSIGSFGALEQNLSINLSKGKWHLTSKYFHESSNRDFDYEVSPSLPLVTQKNASYNRNHFVQDVYFDINKSHHLAAHFWVYSASTQIPPTTVQENSVANQDDSAIRSIISYKHIGKKSLLEGKVGYFKDYNNFYDSAILLEALNTYDTWFADLNIQVQKSNHTFSAGSTFNYTNARSEGYEGTANQSKFGIFATHLYERSKLKIKTSIRQEIVDNSFVPFTPNVALLYNPIKWLEIHSKISRDFRMPTLNDRFWKPGGNEDLFPESGWSQEIGFRIHQKLNRLTSEYGATLFYRDVENWIIWSPGQDVQYWAAQNINNVISKGIEQRLSLKYSLKDILIKFDLSYDYLSSEFQTALSIPKVEAGDQLLYNPKHNARVALAFENDLYKLNYQHSFTGMTRGVNEDLPSFQVANLIATIKSKIAGLNCAIHLSINNLYSRRYFIVERRPIAGRNYNIGITLKY